MGRWKKERGQVIRQEVVDLLVLGRTEIEIAVELGIHRATVGRIKRSEYFRKVEERLVGRTMNFASEMAERGGYLIRLCLGRLIEIIEDPKTNPKLVHEIMKDLLSRLGMPPVKAVIAKVDARDLNLLNPGKSEDTGTQISEAELDEMLERAMNPFGLPEPESNENGKLMLGEPSTDEREIAEKARNQDDDTISLG